MPYTFLIADILSWWLTKIHPMFAWLVIFAGMGMAISFMFMWVTSILEMWLFKPVFVDGVGSKYLLWRDSKEPSAVDRLLSLLKSLFAKIEPTAAWALQQWSTRAWPLLKGLFKK
jgi:hypothetical protein